MPTPYDILGGEEAVRSLVHRFYTLMDQNPECKTIRDLHPQDLSTSEEKLFWFLSGWLGGPDLYVQKKGHPMLRRRHLPFKIGDRERDQWMNCMKQALEEMELDPDFHDQLVASFQRTADHMRNTA